MSARADAVAAVVAERELDALLVVEEFNLRWLTGYTGTNGLALVGDDLRVFLTDFRYVEQAEHEVDPAFDRRAASATCSRTGATACPSAARSSSASTTAIPRCAPTAGCASCSATRSSSRPPAA